MTCDLDNTDFICISALFTLFKKSYTNVTHAYALDDDSEQTHLQYTYLIPVVPASITMVIDR